MEVRKIVSYRKALGMNQAEMAKKLELSTDGYSKKERGITEFRPREMRIFLDLVRQKDSTVTLEDIFF